MFCSTTSWLKDLWILHIFLFGEKQIHTPKTPSTLDTLGRNNKWRHYVKQKQRGLGVFLFFIMTLANATSNFISGEKRNILNGICILFIFSLHMKQPRDSLQKMSILSSVTCLRNISLMQASCFQGYLFFFFLAT